MFSGSHVIIYSQSADADRAVIRDQLGFANVDAGDGWLIFKLPPAELAIHPIDGEPRYELYLMCDDIAATVARLTKVGVPISGPIRHMDWGSSALIVLPSGARLGIYQPRHPVAHDL